MERQDEKAVDAISPSVDPKKPTDGAAKELPGSEGSSMDLEKQVEAQENLKRNLKSRHLQMIAIGAHCHSELCVYPPQKS